MSSSNSRMLAEQLSMLDAPDQEASKLKRRISLLEKELEDKTEQLNGVPDISSEMAQIKQTNNALDARMNDYENKIQELLTSINDLVNCVQTKSVELDVVKQLLDTQMKGLSMSNSRNDTQNRGVSDVENSQHQLPDLTQTEVAEPAMQFNQGLDSISAKTATETNKEANLAENVDDTADDFEMRKLTIKNVRVYESRLKANSMEAADKCDLVVEAAKGGFTLSYTVKGELRTVWLKLGGKVHCMRRCEKGVIVECYKDEERSILQPLVLIFKNEDDIDMFKWFVNDV